MKQPEIRPLYSAETIDERVTRLGERVHTDLAADDPLVIALLSGAVIFLADLVRAIQAPVRYEFIRVEYTPAPSGGGVDVLEIQYPLPLEVRDQTILVVKDVVSSGVTESYLRAQFLAKGARRVHLAALVDLPHERKTDFVTDYCVFTAQRTARLVGYGLRYRGRFGNLPFIGRLSAEEE